MPSSAVFRLSIGPVKPDAKFALYGATTRKYSLYIIGSIRFSCQFSASQIVKLTKSSLNSAAALAIIRKTRYCKGNNLIVFDLNLRFYLLSIIEERVSMKIGHFSDTAREYVITTPAHATAVDQLSGQRGILQPCFPHGRWVQLLQGCQAAAYHSLPLQ